MRIFVLGATGRTGREVVHIALARGHQLTAFVRSPERIRPASSALAVVKGDVLDAAAMARALAGHDAVVSTLGLPGREALRPSSFMTQTGATLVSAMKRAHVERLAILSAAVLFAGEGLSFRFFKWFLRNHARDLSDMEAVVRATDLDYTIARPPRLIDAPDEAYQSAPDSLPNGKQSISFRAVGAFLIDAIERDLYSRQIAGLTSRAS